jgi:DNA-binding transcriptional LysR family regulator
MAKLQLVAAGLAITTMPPVALGVLPEGVRAVAVRGEPQEARRLVLARLPGPMHGGVATVAEALIAAARLR